MKLSLIISTVVFVSVSYGAEFPTVSVKSYHFKKTNVGNWYKAFHYCDTQGMRLATILSKDENDRFVKIASDAGVRDKFWLGAIKMDDDKFYHLGLEEPITYFNWWKGEPSNNGGNENCVEIFAFENGNFQWNDAPCHHTKYFMCEIITKSDYSAIF